MSQAAESSKRPARVLAAATLVVAVGWGLTACGSGSGGGSKSGNGRSPGTAPTDDTSASSYVGLTEQAAIAKAKAAGTPWRITREDGETFLVTQDYVPNRINFEIDKGKVTKATYG